MGYHILLFMLQSALQALVLLFYSHTIYHVWCTNCCLITYKTRAKWVIQSTLNFSFSDQEGFRIQPLCVCVHFSTLTLSLSVSLVVQNECNLANCWKIYPTRHVKHNINKWFSTGFTTIFASLQIRWKSEFINTSLSSRLTWQIIIPTYWLWRIFKCSISTIMFPVNSSQSLFDPFAFQHFMD